MTKSDLIHRLAEQAGISENQANKIFNTTVATISNALANGEDVRITGFGTFRVVETKERVGRNPRTGEQIKIPASRRVSFAAGSQLAESVRGRQPQKRAA